MMMAHNVCFFTITITQSRKGYYTGFSYFTYCSYKGGEEDKESQSNQETGDVPGA